MCNFFKMNICHANYLDPNYRDLYKRYISWQKHLKNIFKKNSHIMQRNDEKLLKLFELTE